MLRENEWLMGIKQRASMPGGTCQFDLPSYHYWQQQPASVRRSNLKEWLSPLLPISVAVNLLLNLLRENGRKMSFTAHHGSFQQMQGGRAALLLRISVNSDIPCIPELGANKYAINIRFVAATFGAKPPLYEHDVPFELTFCTLSS